MEYLVEIYDARGRKIDSWRSGSSVAALSELARRVLHDDIFDFVNASCYYHSVEQWNLEIK